MELQIWAKIGAGFDSDLLSNTTKWKHFNFAASFHASQVILEIIPLVLTPPGQKKSLWEKDSHSFLHIYAFNNGATVFKY